MTLLGLGFMTLCLISICKWSTGLPNILLVTCFIFNDVNNIRNFTCGV